MVAAGDPIEAADVNVNAGFAQITADSTTWNATESGALMTVNCNFINGEEYWITCTMNVSADVAADSPVMRIRDGSATGTQLVGRQGYCPSTSTIGYLMTFGCKVTALATGVKTYVVTGQRNGGTGTAHRIRASGSNPAAIKVDLIQ